jgi:hypothetical protein
MKKLYLSPALQVEEAESAQMLATSLIVNRDKTVDGDEALVKGDNDWDIWSDE